MKLNKKISKHDEIDLGEIIKTLWNEKILILSISLIFMVIGYVYGALIPKIYKTEITIREAPSSLFEAYRSLPQPQLQLQSSSPSPLPSLIQESMAGQFNNNFKLNLSSLDTLVQFVENNNAINDFKNYLKEKNISVAKYFQPKLDTKRFVLVINKNNIQNKYSLTYSQPLPGEAFLNDYIIFAHQKTITMFKQQLIQSIINEIKIHQNHLEIAKKINLDKPILQSMLEGQTVVNEPRALFYKGTKVLSQQISYLNRLLNEAKNLTLDYNPILEQPISGTIISKSPTTFLFLGFLLGLFFSFITIFVKKLLI
jgi:LPS O-antigen subunit length determinant protein (WzzB/FepE family)